MVTYIASLSVEINNFGCEFMTAKYTRKSDLIRGIARYFKTHRFNPSRIFLMGEIKAYDDVDCVGYEHINCITPTKIITEDAITGKTHSYKFNY